MDAKNIWLTLPGPFGAGDPDVGPLRTITTRFPTAKGAASACFPSGNKTRAREMSTLKVGPATTTCAWIPGPPG